MKHHISTVILLAAAMLAGGCADDELELVTAPVAPEQAGNSPLKFSVEPYTVKTTSGARASEPSDTPEPESAEEKTIHDFWLFQFNTAGARLADPIYYAPAANSSETLSTLTTRAYSDLTKDTPMTIYVVANTGDATWANASTGFNTLQEVKKQRLPQALPIRAHVDDILIPMSGQLDNVTVADKSMVVVPLTRMYAKMKIKADFSMSDMTTYDVDVTDIPFYCKVTSMVDGIDGATGEPMAVDPPAGTIRVSSAFTSTAVVTDENGEKWHVLYIPENICGEITDADKRPGQEKNIPANAIAVNIRAKCKGRDYYFTIYPGENDKNNFNIRRNRVYRVIADVKSAQNQHNPSANCFIVKPHSEVVFEPYNRDEKGGDHDNPDKYNIRTYLDPNDPLKKIAYLKIIWQTKDCIGDNEHNKLVWLGEPTTPPENQEITVLTGEEGNALVGAYNSKNEIIWSWHIWVTPNEPDNLGNAIVYTTYRWDKEGIYDKEPRIPGYAVMQCNLGALAFSADNKKSFDANKFKKEEAIPNSQVRTFGMLYQWGRKDPFPPMTYFTGTEDSNGTLDYTNQYTEIHYANDNSTIVNKTNKKTSGQDLLQGFLFCSIDYDDNALKSSATTSAVRYSIQHPTVYIAHNAGDWCSTDNQSDDTLWGGLKPKSGMRYTITETNDYGITSSAHLEDNYGTKSIFDPCPHGWRVAPGDIWLGFTIDGRNPKNTPSSPWNPKYDAFDKVNFNEDESKDRLGLSMYMQAWQSGPTSFFPLPGTRQGDGECKNTGLCGNYHNATCDDDGRVNILHMHRDMSEVSIYNKNLVLFKLFEFTTPIYYAKSTAGPIRCVRDKK